MIFPTRTFIATLVVSVALAWGGPAAASAQDCVAPSPTQDQYCPPVPPPLTTVDRGSDPPSASSTAGSLPFTGYDAGMAALAAVVLIGAGLGLRRASRADEGM